ncbi:MAG: glutamate 5-kinase [Nitrospinota bacterium]|nr:glutamate 5-kinase [Nitrospinota bacterium]
MVTKKIKRVVVKVGSAVLMAKDTKSIDDTVIRGIAKQLSLLHNSGLEVILVSSGAVVAGIHQLKIKLAPDDISGKQAAASVGQSLLVGKYEKYFSKRGKTVAQILLTHADLSNRNRYLNAKTTLMILLKSGVIPIINENDTVSVDELKFGDNDAMSAMVADMVDAELLIILSDVKGLYSSNPTNNPEAKIIDVVDKIDGHIKNSAWKSSSAWGSGGMVTKIEAAERCMSSGIEMVIAEGKNTSVIKKILEGKKVGTTFKPSKDRAGAKKRWIAHTLKRRGKIYIDNGAREAVISKHRSLLPAGIVKVEGNFLRGDAISFISAEDNREIGVGLVNYDSKDIARIQGCHTSKIGECLGFRMGDEVIHRDNMVFFTGDDDA